MTVFVSKHDDTIRFVDTPLLEGLKNIGETRVDRVSHVFPINPLLRLIFRWLRDRYGEKGRIAAFTRRWPCVWQADLGPVDGPVLRPFKDRQKAIEAEIQWLEQNNLGRRSSP